MAAVQTQRQRDVDFSIQKYLLPSNRCEWNAASFDKSIVYSCVQSPAASNGCLFNVDGNEKDVQIILVAVPEKSIGNSPSGQESRCANRVRPQKNLFFIDRILLFTFCRNPIIRLIQSRVAVAKKKRSSYVNQSRVGIINLAVKRRSPMFLRTENIFVNASLPHVEQSGQNGGRTGRTKNNTMTIVKQINPLKLHHTTMYKSKLSKQKSTVVSAGRRIISS